VDRLFLDANVLFSAAYREESPLRRLWRQPRAELITSAYALVEVERHLDAERKRRLLDLVQGMEIVPDVPTDDLPPGIALRDKDAPILVAAIAASATHLITGDRRDFGSLFGRKVGGVLVLPPRSYLASLPGDDLPRSLGAGRSGRGDVSGKADRLLKGLAYTGPRNPH